MIFLATMNSALGEDTLAYVISVGLGSIIGELPSENRLIVRWFINSYNMLYVQIFDASTNEGVPNLSVNLLLQFSIK